MRIQDVIGRRPGQWLSLILLPGLLAGCDTGAAADQGTSAEENAEAESYYDGIVIYLQKPGHWEDARIHFWQVDAGHGESDWPGETMESAGDGWYRYAFDEATLVNTVLNGPVGDDTEQSIDFQRSASSCLILDLDNPDGEGHYDGEWTRECDPMTAEERQDPPAPDLSHSEATGDTDRTAFVHLFEWSWQDIAQECTDYLGPNGFTAVQVSPPQEHIVGDTWWTRYQPVSYRLESRSGSRDEFVDMIATCADAGVDIYADLVINHTADMDSVNDIGGLSAGGPEGFAGTEWARMAHDSLFGDERDQRFAYDRDSYHEDCVIQGSDYNNDADRVRTCQLAGLPDLKTGDSAVQDTLANYITELLDLGMKGLRVDAAKHMAVADIDAIVALVEDEFDGEYYRYSEVIDMAGTEAITADEYVGIGPVEEFKYSAGISRIFKQDDQPLQRLKGLGEPMDFLESAQAVVFTDNHDNQRGHGAGGNILTYKDGDRYTLGNLFMLAHPYGYPRLMSSYAFDDTEMGPPSVPVHNGSLNCGEGDWVCEHRQPEIRAMVDFRRVTAGSGIAEWWDNDANQIAFARDGAGFFALNGEPDSDMDINLQTTLPEGSYCNVIAAADADCADHQVTVDAGGETTVALAPGEAMALVNEDVPPFGSTDLYVRSDEQQDGGPAALMYAGSGLYTGTAVFDPANAEAWGNADYFDFKIADADWSDATNYGSDGGMVLSEGETGELERGGHSGNLQIAVTDSLLEVALTADFSDPENATLTIDSLNSAASTPEPPLPTLADNTLRLHFQKDDGDLDGYVIHAWEDIDYDFSMSWNATNPEWGHAYQLDGESWVVWDIPVVDDWSQVGVVIHRDEAKHVDPDQMIREARHGQEAFVMHGDSNVHAERPVDGEAEPGDDFSRASAHWVTADNLIWDSRNATEDDHHASEYVLYYADDAALSLDDGAVVGADGRIALSSDGAWSSDRFPHLAGQSVLALPDDALNQVPSILQGAVGVVRYQHGELMDATRLQTPGVLDDLYAEDALTTDLGVTFNGSGPAFRLWAPTAKSVTLRVYDSPQGDVIATPGMIRDDDSGVWAYDGASDWATNDHYYRFDVEVFVPSVGEVVTNRVTDPYAHGLSTDSQRTLIVDLDHADTKPSNWDDLTLPSQGSPLDASIYELHVRDFSVNDASTPEQYWGTYRAFTLDDTAPINHLRALQEAGLTHLHLLPTYDLGSIPEASPRTVDLGAMNAAVADDPASEVPQQKIAAINDENPFNWGYDPWHYTTPEGSYATDPDGVTRIVEYREMIQSMADMGLRVTKDIVYNHTFDSGQGDMSVLDRIVPGYYYRLDEGGSIHTSTCCPNTATEHAMMEKLMLDSMETWAEQYRIGAFRFDLMGHHMVDHVKTAVDRVQAIDPDIYVYGEGWDFGEVQGGQRGPNATQFNMAGTGIGTFNDRYRDAIRGGSPFDGGNTLIDAKGVMNVVTYENLQDAMDRVRTGLAANLADYEFLRHDDQVRPGSHGNVGYAETPADVINYVSKHDNQTLFDNNVYKLPADATMADRVRAQNLGVSLTTLAQGIPFYHAGVDLLRSKSLDRNSYNSDDWFNRVNFGFENASNTDYHTTLNNFGVGLPLAADNEDSWEVMEPLLAMRDQLVPSPEHMERTRDHLREMLAIRQNSPLFRLRTAEDIEARLRFHNTGASQVPGLVVMTLSDNVDGEATLDATYGSAIVLANLGPDARSFSLPAYDGDTSVALHPVQAAGTDERLADMTFDRDGGTFDVPGRTVAVFMATSDTDPSQ